MTRTLRGVAAPALAAAAAWLVGWGLMVVAMMLPGAVPFVRGVGGAVSGRSPARERGFATAGFLGVWVVAGIAALGAVALGAGIAAGPVLVAAGLYQLSPAKRRALAHCRAHARLLPPGWAAGRDPSGDALRAGLAHGRASVACCGPLMAAVAVLAMDRPILMLAAGCAMTVEAGRPSFPPPMTTSFPGPSCPQPTGR